jgi:gluconate 2-dehydrogenase gamma chain
MKRRTILKGISLTSLGMTGLNPQVQAAEYFGIEEEEGPGKKKKKKEPWEPYGRTDAEKERDAKIFADTFFNPHEMATLAVLCDIIIPKDDKSGSATDAGVPDFIEFMAKDQPSLQVPLRGGLGWMDAQANKRFGKVFVDCAHAQRIEIIEDIAYPGRKRPGMSQGVSFFSLVRNLTATGFFTTKMGIDDLGYVGNTPNQWEGPPAEVLKQYGVE